MFKLELDFVSIFSLTTVGKDILPEVKGISKEISLIRRCKASTLKSFYFTKQNIVKTTNLSLYFLFFIFFMLLEAISTFNQFRKYKITLIKILLEAGDEIYKLRIKAGKYKLGAMVGKHKLEVVARR